MKKYLFDTNVYSLIFSKSVPEKWTRYWKEVCSKKKQLIIFEMLISEIFYINSSDYGFKTMREKLGDFLLSSGMVQKTIERHRVK